MRSLLATSSVCVVLSCFIIAACGASSDGATLSFLTIGDWGKRNEDQHEVASEVQAWQQNGVDFVVSTGDNFYELGVTRTDDPQWNSTWRDVYTEPMPWYSVLGNHDHYGVPWAQIEYSKKQIDERWIMPDYHYTFTKTLADGTTVQFVMVDTIQMSPGSTVMLIEEAIRWGIATIKHFLNVKEQLEEHYKLAPAQLRWIEETLAASTADWLIVTGHYPVYSGGEHGNTAELHKVLLPLLNKYNVDAYICGHDHTLQHLRSDGVEYFVSGNGAKRGHVKNITESVWSAVDPGFMLHEVSKDSMDVTVVDEKGNVVHTAQVARKRNL